MSQYQVQANLDIFDQWNHLADRVEQLKNIVQNDMLLDFPVITEWTRVANQAQSDLENLINVTREYVKSYLISDPNWNILASTPLTKIRIRLTEVLTKEEAEAIAHEGCEAHEYTFHGVYSDEEIDVAESELDIPF